MKSSRKEPFDLTAAGVRLLLRFLPGDSPVYQAIRASYRTLKELRESAAAGAFARFPFADLHDRSAWRKLLALHRCPPWRVDAERDVAGAAGLVLELLLTRAPRFPRALTSGPDGDFARWILDGGATLGPRGREHVLAVFRSPPGERVQLAYDADVAQRQRHPLALMPAGRVAYLHWLLAPKRRRRFRLQAHHIAWFALAGAEDETAGVVPTYLRTPRWQGDIPEGLGSGYARLATWAAKELGADMPAELPPRYVAPGSSSPSGALPWRSLGAGARVEGVNVLGYQRYAVGLGEAARNTVRALEGAGFSVAQRDVLLWLDEASGRHLDLECHPVTLLHTTPDATAHGYETCGLWRRPGVYRIGVWYWELETCDPNWREGSDYLDEIWCPSRFIADAMRTVMRVPITTMLPGIEMPRFSPRARAFFGLPEDRFLFLFVFDMSSTFERKNPLAIVRAFREAFSPRDPVSVVLKVTRGSSAAKGHAALAAEVAKGGVILIDDVLARADLYALIDTCDAYVSLHRSEGYGLTMAEAMALGKPVIATGYSGNLDFMTPETARLVGYRMDTLAHDVGPYRKGARWAEPDVAEAARWMRWAFDDRAAARALGEAGREAIRRIASLEGYGRRMSERLAEIGARGLKSTLVP